MLKQILKDMYVDPDILAELPEEQKQILFFKIREEQKRRYVEHEKECQKKAKKAAKKSGSKLEVDKGKKVRIMEDTNGQPWTWVMGEHPNDVPIEEIWGNIGSDGLSSKKSNGTKSPVSKVQALIQARNKRIENEQDRPDENVENQNTNNNNVTVSPKAAPAVPARDIKQTPATELRPPKPPTNSVTVNPKSTASLKSNKPPPPIKPQIVPKPVTQRTKQEPPKLPQRAPVAPLGPQRIVAKGNRVPPAPVTKKPTASPAKTSSAAVPEKQDSDEDNVYEAMDEISDSLPIKDLEDREWQKQLRQYKAADEHRKLHARRASMEVRRLSQTDLVRGQKLIHLREKFQRKRSQRELNPNNATIIANRPVLPPKPTNLRPRHPAARSGRPAKPSSRSEVVEWFKETQWAEIMASMDDSNTLPVWFHGIISRNKAESLLENKAVGDYLIRVSEKIWGYALSYKDENKIKHFLIDGSEPNCYHFFGNDQIRHPGLEQLVAFYQDEEISYGGEILKTAIGQTNINSPDYSDLFDTLPRITHVNAETKDTAL